MIKSANTFLFHSTNTIRFVIAINAKTSLDNIAGLLPHAAIPRHPVLLETAPCGDLFRAAQHQTTPATAPQGDPPEIKINTWFLDTLGPYHAICM